jgi:hypothetical protein
MGSPDPETRAVRPVDWIAALRAYLLATAFLDLLREAAHLALYDLDGRHDPRQRGRSGDHGGMMNMMGQTSPDHMKQMTAMIDNCNRMMESASKSPTRLDK